jgi:diguanylate cyclase
MHDFDLFRDDDIGLSAAVLTQKSLVDTQAQLGSMLEVMPIGVLIHTEQGILFANKEACRLLQLDRARALGQHFLDHVPASDVENVAAQLRASFLAQSEPIEQECLIERPDGSQRLVKLVSGKLPWAGNPVVQILLHDVTDQKRAENSLRQLTITDELTGAYNRRHLLYESALYIDPHGTHNVPLSVVLLDIDHFKDINDKHGHAVGDIALRELTSLMNALIPTVRGADSAIFARIGGEEFVLLLPGFELMQASTIADRFRKAIGDMKIAIEGGLLRFSVSMGVAQYRKADQTIEETLGRADKALYSAKNMGRNRVETAR